MIDRILYGHGIQKTELSLLTVWSPFQRISVYFDVARFMLVILYIFNQIKTVFTKKFSIFCTGEHESKRHIIIIQF